MNNHANRQYTVAVSYFRNLLQACTACGLDGLTIQSQAGLADIDKLSPDDRLSVEVFSQLWQIIDVCSGGDPLIGLKMGSVKRKGMLGILEFLLMSSDTVGDAVELLVRYWRLVSDEDKTFELKLIEGNAHFQFSSILNHHHATFESATLYMKQFVEVMLGVTLEPEKTKIYFIHPLPDGATVEDFSAAFCCEVKFCQQTNAMIFDASLLNQKLAHSDNLVHPLLREKADLQLRALDTHAQVSQRVLFLIESGATELSDIASTLGLSIRSLQRKLRSEDQSFRNVLDSFKKSKCSRLFEEGWLSTKEIAFSLGFKEERAFFLASRRWFSMTPSQYRSHLNTMPSKQLSDANLL